MTSMVDVTFLLLIFFMVTASFDLQRSLQVPRQESSLASHQSLAPIVDPEQIVYLTVDAQGVFVLQTDSGESEWVGKQNLVTALRQTLQNMGVAASSHPSTSQDAVILDLDVDPRAQLQSLVDAIDAAGLAGFETIRFHANEQGANFPSPLNRQTS